MIVRLPVTRTSYQKDKDKASFVFVGQMIERNFDENEIQEVAHAIAYLLAKFVAKGITSELVKTLLELKEIEAKSTEGYYNYRGKLSESFMKMNNAGQGGGLNAK